jgi:preprotein translocase subunit SecG
VGILTGILFVLVVIISILLVCVILIQRGKGGGLAGAFGGAGGSSAFGTKAGDVFTRITLGMAGMWVLLCMALVILTQRDNTMTTLERFGAGGAGTDVAPADTDSGKAVRGNSTVPVTDDLPPVNPPAGGGAGAMPAAPGGVELGKTADGAPVVEQPEPSGAPVPAVPAGGAPPAGTSEGAAPKF